MKLSDARHAARVCVSLLALTALVSLGQLGHGAGVEHSHAVQAPQKLPREAPESSDVQHTTPSAEPQFFWIGLVAGGSAPGADLTAAGIALGTPELGGTVEVGAGCIMGAVVLDCQKAGDANNDNDWSSADIIYLVNYIFRANAPPQICAQGDANGDGQIIASDIIYMVNMIFRAGPQPMCGPAGMTC